MTSRRIALRVRILAASTSLLWSLSAHAAPEAVGAAPAERDAAAQTKERAAPPAPGEHAAPPAPGERAAPPAAETLPDPAGWHQTPPPVLEKPLPDAHVPKLELGVNAGVVSRPSLGDRVHYGLGWAVGPHVRVDLLKWLAARIQVRFEGNAVSFDDGALGLPSGTAYDAPAFHRVVLGAALEPTWSPAPHLDLWVGLGVGWGRTTLGGLHTTGAESITLPIRSAVFVEFPVSLGMRYRILRERLVLNLSGSASLLTNQSGGLETNYETPGTSGTLTTVGGFPKLGASIAALAGVGVLL